MKADMKKKALRRLSLIKGQLNGLTKEALSGVEDLMLENHLTTHVVAQVKSGRSKKAVEEILKVYKLAQKKK